MNPFYIIITIIGLISIWAIFAYNSLVKFRTLVSEALLALEEQLLALAAALAALGV